MIAEEERRSRGRRFATTLLPPAVTFVVVVGAWYVAVSEGLVTEFILPRPRDVVVSFYELLFEENIWNHVWATTWVTVVGFVLGSGLGILLALAVGLSRTLNSALYPYVVGLQVTPRIALAPIIIAWLGFGDSPKVAIVVLIVFFPVFINMLAGIASVDRDSEEMFRSLGASRRQTFTGLMLPHALPVLFAGLKTGMTFALLATVVAEFLSATEGLGVLVSTFSYQLNMDDAFAVIVMLALLGISLYILMVVADRRVVYWRYDARMSARTRRFNRRSAEGRAERAGLSGAFARAWPFTPPPRSESTTSVERSSTAKQATRE